jgi:hypothetical protein
MRKTLYSPLVTIFHYQLLQTHPFLKQLGGFLNNNALRFLSPSSPARGTERARAISCTRSPTRPSRHLSNTTSRHSSNITKLAASAGFVAGVVAVQCERRKEIASRTANSFQTAHQSPHSSAAPQAPGACMRAVRGVRAGGARGHFARRAGARGQGRRCGWPGRHARGEGSARAR